MTMTKTMKLYILAAFALSTASSYETPRLRAAHAEGTADNVVSEMLNPESTSSFERQQNCVKKCRASNPNKTQTQCRLKCNGRERSTGTGKIFTLSPTSFVTRNMPMPEEIAEDDASATDGGNASGKDVSEALNPKRSARREAKENCIEGCREGDATKSRNDCRVECTGNERSTSGGKVHTIAPTPTPPPRTGLEVE